MEIVPFSRASLALRWLMGLSLLIVARLVVEPRFGAGIAGGIGIALFMALWIPTVPGEAYRSGSPLRRVLYQRLALFLTAVVVGVVITDLLAAVVR